MYFGLAILLSYKFFIFNYKSEPSLNIYPFSQAIKVLYQSLLLNHILNPSSLMINLIVIPLI